MAVSEKLALLLDSLWDFPGELSEQNLGHMATFKHKKNKV